jgi:tellurite resistance protein
MTNGNRLEYFPISAFSIIMGLTGLALAWRQAERIYELTVPIGLTTTVLSAALFVIFLLVYVAKLLRHRDQVAAEWGHPIKLNFFPTISISLLLLASASLEISPALSYWLWVIGALSQLALTLYVLSAWIHHTRFEIHHINPAWFIPVVGNIIVPIAGIHHAPAETSWFFFSVGIVFWIVLLSINFYRFIFHQPLPERMLPTLFILLAPPAVGFVSYVNLIGEIDAFARILFYIAVFLFLLLVAQSDKFVRIRFSLSWWAYSFPMAALAAAAYRFYQLDPAPAFALMGGVFLALLSIIVLVLVAHTILAGLRGQICVPDA